MPQNYCKICKEKTCHCVVVQVDEKNELLKKIAGSLSDIAESLAFVVKYWHD